MYKVSYIALMTCQKVYIYTEKFIFRRFIRMYLFSWVIIIKVLPLITLFYQNRKMPVLLSRKKNSFLFN